ncbi:MAG: RloB family protein [Bacteroidota bacterium]|nr:RloB family protein [Bacteroidota bacterium]
MPKKTKSIKITDRRANKAWLKKVRPSEYKIETKEPEKVILIVGEGQTEKLYFESFPVLSLTVEAVDLGGQSKQKLIESTESIIKERTTKYDEIWCVFDMDIKKGEKEFSDFDNAIRSGEAKGYNIAYSNDAFEVWFYLHYQYNDQENHRKFYYKALGEKWNLNYEKDGKTYDFCKTIYSKLLSDEDSCQAKAIERAKKLFKTQENLDFHKQNPVTKVYELVEYLNSKIRK